MEGWSEVCNVKLLAYKLKRRVFYLHGEKLVNHSAVPISVHPGGGCGMRSF